MTKTTKSTVLSCLTILFLISAVAACSRPPAIVGEVSITATHESAPLSRLLTFTTDQPAIPVVTVSDGLREWTLPAESPDTNHALHVVGLRAGTRHTVGIALRDPDGNLYAQAIEETFETPPLPAPVFDFPPMEVTVSQPERMEPGMTLFSLIRWLPNGEDAEHGLLAIIDEEGEIVWYYEAPHRIVDVRRTPRGTLVYQYNDGIVEIDLLGNEIAHWYASGLWDAPPNDPLLTVDTDSFHHVSIELPTGDILTLGTEARAFDDYPTSETDPAAPRESTHVIGDVALQFNRDGSIVREWRLLDVLDPYRLVYGSLGRFWDREGYDFIDGGTRDWSHANGAIVDPRDGGVIVTLRHQDAAVKLTREGELAWILGDPAGWGERFQPYLLRADGELEWPYHPHAPQITSDGGLMVFDNGNFRAVPPAPPLPDTRNYSRAVEYAIDAAAMTVRQVWAYGGPGGDMFYAPFLGDADRLSYTGNVLITDGGRLVDENGVPTKNVVAARKWARLLEVTGGDNPEKVFEMIIDAGEDTSQISGWSIFQADRIPSLR